MKKFLLLILSPCLLMCHAFAQTGFEKIYSHGGGSMKLIELSDHNFFSGIAAGSYGTGVSIIGPEGSIIESNSYWGGGALSSSVLVPSSLQKDSDDGFYFSSGYVNGTCSGQSHIHPVIGKMDSFGNVVAVQRYELNEGCQSYTRDLEVTNDNSVITWGWDQSFFVMKADPALAHVWSRHFDRPGSFQFVRELPGGDLLAGITMDTAGVVVARMDADGNFLWCKSYIRPKGMVHDCLIDADGSFIITGLTDDMAAANQKLFMMKLNGMGEVQWCKGYASDAGLGFVASSGVRVERTSDGNCILLANLGGRPLLMKTDLNGDTLWTRAAGVDGYGYEILQLLVNSDGGYLYDGLIYGDLPESNTGLPFIYKTDSLGHLPCSERPAPQINVTDLFPTDSSFTLLSVDGAVAVLTSVSDTIFDPIVTYDGCLITTVSDHLRPHQRFSIYPNPTTGRFTAAFKDPLTANSYYSVFDTMGRLLYQRPLPVGKETEEIDLSPFRKGTYLIKFTDRAGACYERVVVE